jgi:hypothetical protein
MIHFSTELPMWGRGPFFGDKFAQLIFSSPGGRLYNSEKLLWAKQNDFKFSSAVRSRVAYVSACAGMGPLEVQ